MTPAHTSLKKILWQRVYGTSACCERSSIENESCTRDHRAVEAVLKLSFFLSARSRGGIPIIGQAAITRCASASLMKRMSDCMESRDLIKSNAVIVDPGQLFHVPVNLRE
jgi:hypothetical protein